jgi:hypothetical protein
MDKIINAELPHPEINGPPLERGIRYAHHFVVDVISDGRRLYAVASEEGRKILHQIAHGIGLDEGPTVAEWVEAGYSAKNYPPSGYNSRSTPEEIAEAIKAEEATVALGEASGSATGGDTELPPQDDGLEPATGGTPQPIGNVTTEVSQANSFDS